VAVGGTWVGCSGSVVAVSATGSSVTSGVAVASGGNSPVGIALVDEGISVRILATRVAISESLTGGGVAVVNGNVHALSSPINTIRIIIRKRIVGRIGFFSLNLSISSFEFIFTIIMTLIDYLWFPVSICLVADHT
jgi:hypothetical protein